MGKKSEKLKLSIPENVYKRIQKLAKRHDKSVAEVIRFYLREGVGQLPVKKRVDREVQYNIWIEPELKECIEDAAARYRLGAATLSRLILDVSTAEVMTEERK